MNYFSKKTHGFGSIDDYKDDYLAIPTKDPKKKEAKKDKNLSFEEE